LLRLLLRRLALKLPTALQFKPFFALLFHEGGVKVFQQLGAYDYNELASEIGPLGRIWALVDSNDDLIKPASLFKDGPSSSSWPRPLVPYPTIGPEEGLLGSFI